MQASPITDVLTVGLSYRDLIFSGVEQLPLPGEERYAQAFHEMWGGISTMARVCAALGMNTSLATAVGSDEASIRLLSDAHAAGIDTSLTARHEGWRLPVTVAMSLPQDRAMLTVEDALPVDVAAHLAEATFQVPTIIVDLRDPAAGWLQRSRAAGSKVFASRGFDPTGQWGDDELSGLAGADVWVLNDLEATGFTGLTDPLAAARQLSRRVPIVVVTRGAAGMVAVDARIGAEAGVPAFPVTPLSTTGAGDTTLASLAFAHSLPGADLTDQLNVAAFITSSVLTSPLGVGSPPTRHHLVQSLGRSEDPRAGRLHELLAVR